MIDLLSPSPLILLFLVTEGFLQAMKHFSRCLERRLELGFVHVLNVCSEVADKFLQLTLHLLGVVSRIALRGRWRDHYHPVARASARFPSAAGYLAIS